MTMPTGRKLALLIEASSLLLVIFSATTGACPEVARRLLRWATRRCFAADPARARFEEEWLADLEDVPGKLAKLAHAVGVLVFTAAPLWARARWQRSRLAGWLNGVTTRLRLAPAVINADSGGAVLVRAGTVALALAVTGLTATLAVQSAYRLTQSPDATSRASVASYAPVWSFTSTVELSDSSQWAEVKWQPVRSGTVLAVGVNRIPLGTTVRLYLISEDGKRHLIATGITGSNENQAWYSGATTITQSDIKSFEVTAGTTSRAIISARPTGYACYPTGTERCVWPLSAGKQIVVNFGPYKGK